MKKNMFHHSIFRFDLFDLPITKNIDQRYYLDK